MNKTLSMLFALSTVIGCGGGAMAPVAATPVSSSGGGAAPATSTASVASVTGSFNITPQNSKIEWTGAKTTYRHPGSFSSFNGKIELASIRGITKPISFPATITASPTKVDATASFAINRKDFGMTLGGKPEDPIKDDVEVRLTIHADKG